MPTKDGLTERQARENAKHNVRLASHDMREPTRAEWWQIGVVSLVALICWALAIWAWFW